MSGLPYVEIIPKSGACIASNNVVERRGRIRWMVREHGHGPADNGWRVFSAIDTSEYLSRAENMQVVAFNQLCALEPALIGIYDLPVGSDLQVVDDGQRIRIVETQTGRELAEDELYVPGNPPRDWGPATPHPAR
ncbi:MAG: DUF2185 domain-containing protein [Micrococcales bacterium]|nr:DUF2185 domain-containing protein [Micrococcales bacterium]